jgi:short-subunit dehydrogenase
MFELAGKRVLITGASSGLGRELSFEFARKGAVIAIASRRVRRLETVAQEITRLYPQAAGPLIECCDVTDRDSVGRMIGACADHFGGLDILVNNAGIGVYGDTDRTELEDFRAVMEVNFFGALHCIFEALPYLRKTGSGLIVNIASAAAIHGVPYLAAYGASKAALAAAGQSLRAELSPSGVSVMVVYPGYTDTAFFVHEKNVGGAVRPRKRYTPADKVARTIVKAIEHQKCELVLSPEGRALSLALRYFPGLVERAMSRIAVNLRDHKEVSHEQA